MFYLLIMFTTFGFVRQRYHYFIALCAITLGGLFVGSDILPRFAYYIPTRLLAIVVRAYAVALNIQRRQIPMGLRKTIVTRTATWVVPGFKLVLMIVALWIDYLCFDWSDIRERFTPRALLYVSLLAFFLYLLGRVHILRERFAKRPEQGRFFQVLCFCCLGLLYYLLVVTFAYSIYPSIPAGRGGGDLRESQAVVLYCDANCAAAFPPQLVAEVKGGTLSSIPLVAIEEEAESIVVTPLNEYKAWRLARDGSGPVPKLSTFRVRFARSSASVVWRDSNILVGD